MERLSTNSLLVRVRVRMYSDLIYPHPMAFHPVALQPGLVHDAYRSLSMFPLVSVASLLSSYYPHFARLLATTILLAPITRVSTQLLTLLVSSSFPGIVILPMFIVTPPIMTVPILSLIGAFCFIFSHSRSARVVKVSRR